MARKHWGMDLIKETEPGKAIGVLTAAKTLIDSLGMGRSPTENSSIALLAVKIEAEKRQIHQELDAVSKDNEKM